MDASLKMLDRVLSVDGPTNLTNEFSYQHENHELHVTIALSLNAQFLYCFEFVLTEKRKERHAYNGLAQERIRLWIR